MSKKLKFKIYSPRHFSGLRNKSFIRMLLQFSITFLLISPSSCDSPSANSFFKLNQPDENHNEKLKQIYNFLYRGGLKLSERLADGNLPEEFFLDRCVFKDKTFKSTADQGWEEKMLMMDLNFGTASIQNIFFMEVNLGEKRGNSSFPDRIPSADEYVNHTNHTLALIARKNSPSEQEKQILNRFVYEPYEELVEKIREVVKKNSIELPEELVNRLREKIQILDIIFLDLDQSLKEVAQNYAKDSIVADPKRQQFNSYLSGAYFKKYFYLFLNLLKNLRIELFAYANEAFTDLKPGLKCTPIQEAIGQILPIESYTEDYTMKSIIETGSVFDQTLNDKYIHYLEAVRSVYEELDSLRAIITS